MFKSILCDFDEDQFFSEPLCAQKENMKHMMRCFSEPCGAPSPRCVTQERNRGQNMDECCSALRNEPQDMSRSLLPFGSAGLSRSLLPFGSAGLTDTMQNYCKEFTVMSNVKNRMENMNKYFETGGSSGHSYRCSSVMTYSKVGNEPPKMYQATSSIHCGPGGIKETRQALKDTESGVEKFRVGHHIKDRGHIVEQRQNKKTGEKELNQDFQNMDECEAQCFHEQWQKELSKFPPSVCGGQNEAFSRPENTCRCHQKCKCVDTCAENAMQ